MDSKAIKAVLVDSTSVCTQLSLFQMLPPDDVDLANLPDILPYNHVEYTSGSLLSKLEMAKAAEVSAEFIFKDHLREGRRDTETESMYDLRVRNAQALVLLHKCVQGLLKDNMYLDMARMNGHGTA